MDRKMQISTARAVLICIFLSIFTYFYFRITSRISQEASR